MNPDAKAAWLEALRSGRYKQGKGYLRTEKDEFCCLGVLCDLGVKKAWDSLTAPGYRSYNGEGKMPPANVLQAAGLDRNAAGELAEMNDNGCSFEAIAKHIEETQ